MDLVSELDLIPGCGALRSAPVIPKVLGPEWIRAQDRAETLRCARRTLLTAAVLFVATYVVVALGRGPGLRLDRTGAAVVILLA